MKRFLFLVFIVASALLAGVQTFIPTVSRAKDSFGSIIKQQETGEQVKKDTILFVGDVLLARNVERLMRTYGFWYPFAQLQNLDQSSYLVGNFESAIPKVHKETPDLHFAFSTNPTYLEGLITYGFTHMSLGNNHSYDYGTDGFNSTKEELEEVGIATVGDPQRQASSSVEFLSLDGVTVSLIGLYAVDVVPTSQQIQSLLETAQKESDLQVVYVHWGTEYKTFHNKSQEKLAHQLIDAGADVIIGHHPHVVQDIQMYQDKPIFYSLGNFIFDQYFSNQVQEGLMVELGYRDGNYAFTLLPITSIGSRSAPRLMNDFERDEFLKVISKNSDITLATMIQSGTITVPK